MASSDPEKSLHTSSDDSSSSSSEGTDSTPHTPPTISAEVFDPPQDPTTPPQYVRFSPSTYRHTPRSSPAKSKLGIIDEDSDAVSPDVPVRSPLRRFGLPMKFTLDSIPTLHGKKTPPKDIYDDVTGPKGEKFSDLRQNRKRHKSRRCGWKILLLIACVLLIVIAAILVGVLVGLKERNKDRSNQPSSSPATGTGEFPAGNYSITSYLTNTSTLCTTNAATWDCYPQVTYNESPSASLSTINWVISARDNGQFVITSADRVFSYNFQNLPLSRVNRGTDDEYWHFTTTFDKPVLPSQPITSDGATAICYFNNTTLDGRLYTKKPKAQALQATAPTSGTSGLYKPWQYALSFVETRDNGPGVPECFAWVGGQRGSRINTTDLTTSNGAVAQCQCDYANFV